ncbi:phosphotransferase [Paucibacter sp. JuS9]|uniref:protein kinase domain-containing protein n=1 Tax=Paucibacter sp. JuS9 TaxID=3228748 RepID=UPI0037566719
MSHTIDEAIASRGVANTTPGALEATRPEWIDSTNGDLNGLHGNGPPALPHELSDRFELLAELAPATSNRRLFQVRDRASSSEHVLKLAADRRSLTDTRLVSPANPTVDSLALPFEQGSLVAEGSYELQPLIQGVLLSTWLKQHGPLEVDVVRALVTALHHCADLLSRIPAEPGHVWVHCDVKPENIIVTSSQPIRLALIDFGSAALVAGLSTPHSRGRTVAYSAPEMANGEAFINSDLWSIGMIALEALLGRHPMLPESSSGLVRPEDRERVFRVALCRNWQGRDLSSHGSLRAPIEGMLTASPTERWSLETLRLWLAGQEVTESPAMRERIRALEERAPYRIGDVECQTLPDAVTEMARHWSLGRTAITDRAFRAWVRNDCGRPDLADSIHLVSATNVDDILLRLIYRACPELPPVWKDFSLLPRDLAVYARTCLQARSTASIELPNIRSALQYLAWARDGFAVPETCGPIEMMWRQIEVEAAARSNEMAAQGAPTPPIPNIEAFALLLACDQDSVEGLRREVQHALNDNTPRAAWFFGWGRSAQNLSPSQVLVLHGLRLHSEANPGLANAGLGRLAPPSNSSTAQTPADQVAAQGEIVHLTYRFAFRGGLQ